MGVFHKIIYLFNKLFRKQKLLCSDNVGIVEGIDRFNYDVSNTTAHNTTIDESKGNIESDVKKIYKEYMNGSIKEEDLTNNQIDELSEFIDNQIMITQNNITHLKEKRCNQILKNRSIRDLYSEVLNGTKSETDLTEDQSKKIEFIIDYQIEKIENEILKLKRSS